MKALVKTAYGEGNCHIINLEEVSPKPTEVTILVEWAGICGTDLGVFKSTVQHMVPVIMGHEFSGIIEKVGSKVIGFEPGDRVVGETSIDTCGICENCLQGYYNACLKRKGLGRTVHGVFRKKINLQYKLIHKIPEKVTTQTAVLCEPFASCYHAVVERSKVQNGETVLVFGPGIIGFFVAFLSLSRGAEVTVLGLSTDIKRLDICQKIGCKIKVIETNKNSDLSKFFLSNFSNIDIVFECSGNPNAAGYGIDVVKTRGRYIQVGLPGERIVVNLNKIASKELTILGTYSSIYSDFEAVLSLMNQSDFDFSCLISSVFPLESWEKAFHDAQEKDFMKIVMKI